MESAATAAALCRGSAAAPAGSCEHASAGNRAWVTSMATMYSTTRPLMQIHVSWRMIYMASWTPGTTWSLLLIIKCPTGPWNSNQALNPCGASSVHVASDPATGTTLPDGFLAIVAQPLLQPIDWPCVLSFRLGPSLGASPSCCKNVPGREPPCI